MRLTKQLVGSDVVFSGRDGQPINGTIKYVRNGIATVEHNVRGRWEVFTAYVASDRVVKIISA